MKRMVKSKSTHHERMRMRQVNTTHDLSHGAVCNVTML